MHIHAQSITCKVTLVDQSGSWLLTIVYGATQGTERRSLFQELLFVKELASQIPWLVTGDFNVVRAY